MSDSSQSPPPHSHQRNQGNQNGFNWRMLILFSIAIGILSIGFFYPSANRRGESLSYAEFRRYLDQDRVITDVKDKRLEVITSDTSADATITGWLKPAPHTPQDAKAVRSVFQVPVNLSIQGEEIRNLLGKDLAINEQTGPVSSSENSRTFSLDTFRKELALGNIVKDAPENPLQVITSPGSNNAVITGIVEDIPGTATTPNNKENLGKETRFTVTVSKLLLGTELEKLLRENADYKPKKDHISSIFFTFLPFLLVIGLLFFLFRQQMKAAGRGAMSFGKSKARLLTMDRNKITFKDVAGIQEAKEELFEIVDFLRDPRKFQKLGGSIPKGILMVGSPGTGKTLLARAIAGEADVPFFSISGSDFVEMFVGVGASRVRDMFEQGKKHAPCLIFIDEIDAVGRHRGHGMGGGHDEREQTLNQLLVEMDGFDTQEGVIIIAATNRPDVLDPALLRPGRFDRQVTVSLPDVNGREEILQVHVKKIKLAANTDLSRVARGTPGFSGAELANLVNEAALLAARKGLPAVTIAEMEEARDKVRWGRERRSLAMSEKEKIATAWHEAGHAILLAKLEHAQPLHKVTIIPRGPSLGSTMWLPEGDRYCKQRKEALDDLAVAVGGRIAESFYTSDISNGASGDIRMATNLARTMVCAWGMSDKLGMIEYGDDESPVFLARDMGRSRNYSEETARVIDAEIKHLVDEAIQRATHILGKYRDKVEILANALLDYETLDADHVREILETGEMKNPPSVPKPPPIPDEFRKKPAAKPADKESPENNGPIPGAVGAPA